MREICWQISPHQPSDVIGYVYPGQCLMKLCSRKRKIGAASQSLAMCMAVFLICFTYEACDIHVFMLNTLLIFHSYGKH